MLAQIAEMDQVVEMRRDPAARAAPHGQLTVERVRALTPLRNDVREAQQIYLQLHAQGITPKMIADELERLEKLLEYGLNPTSTRAPSSATTTPMPDERVYGNSDVTGPDAATARAWPASSRRARQRHRHRRHRAAVQIMVLRAVPNGDERDKDVANAIRYAVDTARTSST
jgi:hypothetical protein